MARFTVVALLTLLLLTFGLSCTRTTSDLRGDFAVDLQNIPAEYGNLVSVTSLEDYPGWFQLWFQDDVGTIRIVRIQMFEDLMHRDVKVIPRG